MPELVIALDLIDARHILSELEHADARLTERIVDGNRGRRRAAPQNQAAGGDDARQGDAQGTG